jgi:NitT/TauT family transport system permease protein
MSVRQNKRASEPAAVRRSPSSLLLPWLLPGIVLLTWALGSTLGVFPVWLVPPPRQVLETARIYLLGHPEQLIYAGRFGQDLLASSSRVGAGFLIASLLGIPLGVLSGTTLQVNHLMHNSVNALRAVPGISWLPLVLAWFGIGTKTTIILIAMAAFFPVYFNTVEGVRQVRPVLMQKARMMGLNPLQRAFRVLLPAAAPYIVTGMRLALGISWAYLVLGELTGVPNGMGAIIMDARLLGRIDMIIVGILLIAVIGKTTDMLLFFLMRRTFRSVRRGMVA